MPPADGPTRVTEAVALARRLLAGHSRGQLILLTDGAGAEMARTDSTAGVHLITFGSPADNVAITQFQVRRQLRDIVGYQVFVEVGNFSQEKITCRLEITLNEELIDVVPLEIPANDRKTHVLDHSTEQGGHLWAKLDTADALERDNYAVALLPRQAALPVHLVTRGNLFLEGVLQSIPRVQLTVSDQPPSSVPRNTLLIFDQHTPDAIPPGNVMVIDPNGTCDLWNLGSLIEHPLVATQADDSPLMTHVQLDNVIMNEARQLEILAEHQTLAASLQDEPLYASIDRPDGKVLVLTANLQRGDLPLRTAFPIMMTNAITWFRGPQGEFREALSTGSIVELDLQGKPEPARPAGAPPERATTAVYTDRLFLRDPRGDLRPLPPAGTRLTIGPLDQCGVWQVVTERRTSGEPTNVHAELACNLVNAQESNLQHQHDAAGMTPEIAAVGRRPAWLYLAAVALLFTSVEWLLYQRRWIS
jgi:hypothetical protein